MPLLVVMALLSASPFGSVWALSAEVALATNNGRACQDIYLAFCARCHGDDGLAGPRLAGMTILGDATYLIRQILTGSGGAMPGFRNALSDADIAAVANFLREDWGAALYPAIAPEDVAAERAIVTGR